MRRAQLEHQIDVVEQAGDEAPGVKAHLRAIRADVSRFDALLASRAGRDRVDAALARLGSDIRRAFDDEQRDLSAGLAKRHNEGPEEQRLVAFLGAFALLMAAGLAILITHTVRGDFARAQDMLESSEARFQQLVEQFPAVVYALSLPEDGRPPAPVYVSPQMMAITGVSAEETMRRGLKWLSGHVPEDDQWGLGVAIAAAAGGAPLPPMEFRFVKPGGEEIWLRASSTAVTDGPDGRQLQGLVFDITEAMHAQTEHARWRPSCAWHRSSRPSASSRPGIAHEINTPVQFVGDTVSFLREAFGDLMALQPAQAAVNAPPRPAPSPPSCSSASARPRTTPTSTTCASASRRPSRAPPTALGRVAAIVGAMREFAHPPTTEQRRSTSTARCATR